MPLRVERQRWIGTQGTSLRGRITPDYTRVYTARFSESDVQRVFPSTLKSFPISAVPSIYVSRKLARVLVDEPMGLLFRLTVGAHSDNGRGQ